MNNQNIQKELLSMDIDEDTVEEIMDKLSEFNGGDINHEQTKENKIKELQARKEVEVDWRKKSIIAAQIIKINLE